MVNFHHSSSSAALYLSPSFHRWRKWGTERWQLCPWSHSCQAVAPAPMKTRLFGCTAYQLILWAPEWILHIPLLPPTTVPCELNTFLPLFFKRVICPPTSGPCCFVHPGVDYWLSLPAIFMLFPTLKIEIQQNNSCSALLLCYCFCSELSVKGHWDNIQITLALKLKAFLVVEKS